jgi:hypothetical protein
VCNIWTNTEVILNTHLSGKTHIKKLEQAGPNAYLPPVLLGPIPAQESIKAEKWKTGEKRKYSDIDPTNKGHFACEVCTLEFNSRVVYETHMQGKKHSRMLKVMETINSQNVDISCTVCNFIATSPVHLDAHLQGKNHKKRMEAQGKSFGPPLPKEDPDAPKKGMLQPSWMKTEASKKKTSAEPQIKKGKKETSWPNDSTKGGQGQGYDGYYQDNGEGYYDGSGYEQTGYEGYDNGNGVNGSGAGGYYGD